MFGVDSTELAIVAILALIFIGPKDLPKVMRTVGYWVGRVRGMARHFTSGIESMVREAELEEMEKKWREDNERIMRCTRRTRIIPNPASLTPCHLSSIPDGESDSCRPMSDPCREGHRRHQAAAARTFDRA